MVDKGTRATTHSRDAEKVGEKRRRAEPDLGHAGDLAGGLSVFDSLLADPGMEQPVEKHAALLGDARFAHPANSSQKARMVGRLQNDYGNAHVQRVVQSIAVQPKLVVSPPDDQYEREADRVADVATKPAEPRLQRQREEGEEETLATKALGTAPQLPLQRKTGEGEEDEAQQTRLVSPRAPQASDSLEKRINAARDSGRALGDPVRAELEPRLGRDLGNVRIHTDAEADQLSRELSAKAFTTGRDVFFREAHYQPASSEGKRLLAHELAHVAQQSPAPSASTVKAPTSSESPKSEAQARAPAVTVAQRGEPGAEVSDLSPAAAVLQRQAAPSAGPGPSALKIKRAFPVERRTKGLKLGPVVLGKTIKGEVSVEGALKAGGGAGPEAEATISLGAEKKAALELKSQITKGLEFKGGVEIGDDSEKIGSGLDLQLYSSGGTTFKAVLDATIWERQGSDITVLAVDVGVSGSTKTVIPLPRSGLTFEGELGLKVTASVEPHWPTISRLAARVGARFVGPAAAAAAKFGAVALPYLVVAAIAVAYIAAIGGGLYMVAEAHRTGRRLGMRRTFAYGYAAALADLIRAGKGATAEMTRAEAAALLKIDVTASFEKAMKWRSEGYVIAALDRAEMAGKAAAVQYLDELLKAHGYDAWRDWCRYRKPNDYRDLLRAQAERDVPIGITIALRKAPSGAAAKPAASRLQRQTEGGEGTLTTKALRTDPRLALQRQTGEREEHEARQTKPVGAKAPEASQSLEGRINAAREGGRALGDPVRAEIEPRLGRDIGHVRIHTDAEADSLSQALQAKAFTTGGDVFLREGHYQPGSPEGKRLLAHELTHLVQQSGIPRVQRQKAPPRARPRYRLVANLGTAQLTVFNGRNKVREMPVIFGRATSTLLKYKRLRIGSWREGFTTPSRTDYTACTWFKWGKELDRFPRVAAGPTGTAGTGVVKVRGRRYKVGTIVPGLKGEIYRHEPKWLKWETIEKYCNPFGKYATVIRGNFMLHGTDGADGLGGPFAGLTPEQRAKVTHGCIRTSNADIEWLKGNVPARTRIKVRR